MNWQLMVPFMQMLQTDPTIHPVQLEEI